MILLREEWVTWWNFCEWSKRSCPNLCLNSFNTLRLLCHSSWKQESFRSLAFSTNKNNWSGLWGIRGRPKPRGDVGDNSKAKLGTQGWSMPTKEEGRTHRLNSQRTTPQHTRYPAMELSCTHFECVCATGHCTIQLQAIPKEDTASYIHVLRGMYYHYSKIM